MVDINFDIGLLIISVSLAAKFKLLPIITHLSAKKLVESSESQKKDSKNKRVYLIRIQYNPRHGDSCPFVGLGWDSDFKFIFSKKYQVESTEKKVSKITVACKL